MPLTFDRLLEILDEEEEERKKQPPRRRGPPPKNPHADEFWLRFACMERPIPQTLYECPVSEPQTTLALWSTLPNDIRAKVPASKVPKEGEDEDVLLEIPSSYLDPVQESTDPEDVAALANKRRPLNGNLTNKLSEYTRGVTGQCRPFRPAGLDSDEVKESGTNEFLTEEASQSALDVLEKGSKAAWEDGSILTAPPGVKFKVGLSYEDVYGKEEKEEDDKKEEAAPKETTAPVTFNDATPEEDDSDDDLGIFSTKPLEKPSFGTTPMWTANDFLDDDSLFGSSDSEDAASESEEPEIVAKQKNKKPSLEDLMDDSSSEDDPVAGETKEEEPSLVAESAKEESTIEVSTDPDEVDELLLELAATHDLEAQQKKKKKDKVQNNAMELAERQSKDQQNSTRKHWANTTLLPIDDIHSWIPNPAMTFPFQLDGFQQQAVVRLERNESVFVAAHTSAGKTVVAEYAVALARQRATRCIYTSPIKALSNQKFRDFSLKFGAENVGLITGDMQINADDSTCIIMTTEILRSMLYRGADLIRDIEWVIFDEVHYVNDTERGVVWEEVIIMLPAYVNLIFLSATTPNTLEFSEWIGRTKRKPVHVVRTDYRPVPLSHHIWAGLKLNKIMEGKSGFLEKGYSDAANALKPKEKPGQKGAGQKAKSTGRPATGSKQLAWQAQGTKQNWMSLIRYLDRELLTPTVTFSFSKKKCEEIANMLRSLDLNTAAEKGIVKGFTLQTRARLSKLDSNLPQVITVCEMVERGIGVHHGGLLPILKEMVEILFSRGLVKALFATETFAMGVNMPARSVVFNSIRKHDGTQFRVLQPGEYVQMAGRAGRRGLDTVGTVILCAFGTEPPPVTMLRNMLTGQSTSLKSQFRLTYNMILNLLRVEEMSVESMIKRSFSEFATQRALTANDYPKLLARGTHTLKKLEESFQADATARIGAEDLEEYFATCKNLLDANYSILSFVMDATNGTGEGVLQPGRIVLVSAARKFGLVRAPALVLRPSARKPGSTDAATIICLALLPESYVPSEGANDSRSTKLPAKIGYIGSAQHRYFQICEIGLGEVLVVTDKKHKISAKDFLMEGGGASARTGSKDFFAAAPLAGRRADLDPFAGMKSLGASKKGQEKPNSTAKAGQGIDQAIKYLADAEEKERDGGLAIMDLKDCARCGSDVMEFRQQFTHMEELAQMSRSFSSHRHPGLERLYAPVERKETLRSKVEALRHMLSNEALNLFPDFLQRKEVLRTLGYVDENETVNVKGRVACEVNTSDELIATEIVFEGILNDLDPPEIVAALSALVFQDKSGDEELSVELPESLRTCCMRMKTIALNLGQLQKNKGLEIDPLEYCETSLRFGLVEVVYEWSLGVPFSKICELTLVQEGSIVRTMTRLDELCREIRNCSRVVGNPTLYRKMEICSVSIKRDIVFASSLYVS